MKNWTSGHSNFCIIIIIIIIIIEIIHCSLWRDISDGTLPFNVANYNSGRIIIILISTEDDTEEESAAGTLTMPSTVIMRVRSTLSFHCNMQSATGDFYVE